MIFDTHSVGAVQLPYLVSFTNHRSSQRGVCYVFPYTSVVSISSQLFFLMIPHQCWCLSRSIFGKPPFYSCLPGDGAIEAQIFELSADKSRIFCSIRNIHTNEHVAILLICISISLLTANFITLHWISEHRNCVYNMSLRIERVDPSHNVITACCCKLQNRFSTIAFPFDQSSYYIEVSVSIEMVS